MSATLARWNQVSKIKENATALSLRVPESFTLSQGPHSELAEAGNLLFSVHSDEQKMLPSRNHLILPPSKVSAGKNLLPFDR